MASLYTKFLDFIGIEENDEADEERKDDGYYRDDADDRGGNVVSFNNGGGRAPAASHRRSERAASSTGSNLPISGGMKMIVYHPVSYEDTQSIIDNLKNRKPVIVNINGTQRLCWPVRYTYDANGNRLGKTTPWGTISWSYDHENRIVSSGATTNTRDSDGNLLEKKG